MIGKAVKFVQYVPKSRLNRSSIYLGELFGAVCTKSSPVSQSPILSSLCNSRHIHTSLPRSRNESRREMLASMPVKDEGTEGERSLIIDATLKRKDDIFPDENTPSRLFAGVPFSDLPICHIRASPNNTILSVTDSKGVVKMLRSCGMEGFKNTRKGTNIAAQATAISLSTAAASKGYKTVRVKVQGLGPGRMSAIKGLQMGGLDIVSITDNTKVSWNPPRPRKQKKL